MPVAPSASAVTDLRARAKLPANQAGGSTVSQFFEMNKASIAAVLPKHVTADRMLKIALGAVRSVPKLLECTVESLFGAVVQCAQLGLEPNTPMGHVYLIPFGNRAKNRTDVQVIIGYRGLLDLARRSGQIISISAHAVRENDEFDFAFGLDERLHHVPARDNAGAIIGFYAVAKLQGGGNAFDVMWRADVDQIKKESLSRLKDWQVKESPWTKHYEEMGRKTAIRRLFKYLPVSIEIARAVEIDGRGEAGKDQGLDTVLSGEWTVVDEPESDGEETADETPTTTPTAQPTIDEAWAADATKGV